MATNGQGSFVEQSAQILERPWLAIQRHALIGEIGQRGGNRCLQRALTVSRSNDREQTTEAKPGFWGTVGGALSGEWEEKQTLGMIAVDTGVSLIPGLDQLADLRDISAHLKYLIFNRQYDSSMRWIGLTLTLLGFIPVAGSAIKGATKLIMTGIDGLSSRLPDLLDLLRRIVPNLVDPKKLENLIAKNWDQWVEAATAAWRRAMGKVLGIARMLPGFLSRKIQTFKSGLARLDEIGSTKLQEAFVWLRQKWDGFITRLRQSDASAWGSLAVTANKAADTVEAIQRDSYGPFELDDRLATRIERERGGGRALDGSTAESMTSALEHDFSDVRIHTDPTADSLNRSLSANAFTTGRDVFFREGKYDTHSDGGRELIAHELTHVVQQSAGRVGSGDRMTVNAPDDAFEREAEAVARTIARSNTGVSGVACALQRETIPEEEELPAVDLRSELLEEEETAG